MLSSVPNVLIYAAHPKIDIFPSLYLHKVPPNMTKAYPTYMTGPIDTYTQHPKLDHHFQHLQPSFVRTKPLLSDVQSEQLRCHRLSSIQPAGRSSGEEEPSSYTCTVISSVNRLSLNSAFTCSLSISGTSGSTSRISRLSSDEGKTCCSHVACR